MTSLSEYIVETGFFNDLFVLVSLRVADDDKNAGVAVVTSEGLNITVSRIGLRFEGFGFNRQIHPRWRIKHIKLHAAWEKVIIAPMSHILALASSCFFFLHNFFRRIPIGAALILSLRILQAPIHHPFLTLSLPHSPCTHPCRSQERGEMCADATKKFPTAGRVWCHIRTWHCM